MSHNESEHGYIQLPAAEFTRLRMAIETRERAVKEEVLLQAQTIWKELPSAAKKEKGWQYDHAVRRHQERTRSVLGGAYTANSLPPALAGAQGSKIAEYIREEAISMLSSAARRKGKPSRPLKADLELPTNKTTSFEDDDWSISFHRSSNTVEWDVDDNNNAVDRARRHPVGLELFDQLAKVKWTKDTGGHFSYNNEYSDNTAVSTAFGPLGAMLHPWQCEPYETATGHQVTEQDLSTMGVDLLRADETTLSKLRSQANGTAKKAGTKAGTRTAGATGVQPRGHKGHEGQFTYKRAGEAGITL